MPYISDFYGIYITMNWKEHGVPHFHAEYAGEEVSISIETLKVLEGKIKTRALAMVLEWANQHREELGICWDMSRQHKHPNKIKGLE